MTVTCCLTVFLLHLKSKSHPLLLHACPREFHLLPTACFEVVLWLTFDLLKTTVIDGTKESHRHPAHLRSSNFELDLNQNHSGWHKNVIFFYYSLTPSVQWATLKSPLQGWPVLLQFPAVSTSLLNNKNILLICACAVACQPTSSFLICKKGGYETQLSTR